MRINEYLKEKTQEAQYTMETTGLCMPKVTKPYTRRVVEGGVSCIKSNKIAVHNQKIKYNDEELSDKIMRGVPVPLANGKTLKLDLTYEQVKHANPKFALKRLEDKRNRGLGMVEAADKEVGFFL